MDKESQKAIYALKETWHKMDSLYSQYAKSVGLNSSSVVIIQFLSDFSQVCTQKDICEGLGLPKQLVNTIIKTFWEQGFVQLKEGKDRRHKQIIITKSGKAFFASILHPLEGAELSAWDSFCADEIIAYAKTTEKYAQAFESALAMLK